jgi:hypothetical protein
MKIEDLQATSKQLGNKILELKNGRINGYTITAYKGYTPTAIEFYGSIHNPTHKVLSYDTAYDLIFGGLTV